MDIKKNDEEVSIESIHDDVGGGQNQDYNTIRAGGMGSLSTIDRGGDMLDPMGGGNSIIA